MFDIANYSLNTRAVIKIGTISFTYFVENQEIVNDIYPRFFIRLNQTIADITSRSSRIRHFSNILLKKTNKSDWNWNRYGNKLFANNLGVKFRPSSDNIRYHLVEIKKFPYVVSRIVFRFEGGVIVAAIGLRRHFGINLTEK